jgi:hypothetical protein
MNILCTNVDTVLLNTNSKEYILSFEKINQLKKINEDFRLFNILLKLLIGEFSANIKKITEIIEDKDKELQKQQIICEETNKKHEF